MEKNNIGKVCMVKLKSDPFNNYVGIIKEYYYGYYVVAIDGDSRVMRHFKPEHLKIEGEN